jgi:hypothetical protein
LQQRRKRKLTTSPLTALFPGAARPAAPSIKIDMVTGAIEATSAAGAAAAAMAAAAAPPAGPKPAALATLSVAAGAAASFVSPRVGLNRKMLSSTRTDAPRPAGQAPESAFLAAPLIVASAWPFAKPAPRSAPFALALTTQAATIAPAPVPAVSAALRMTAVEWGDLVPDLSVDPMFGGFGIVFAARYKRVRVAVKVPRGAALGEGELDVDVVQLLVREAQGMMRASDGGVNAHVVQVFGVVQGEAVGWQAALRLARRTHARMRRCQFTPDPEAAVTESSAASGSAGSASSGGDGSHEGDGVEGDDGEEGEAGGSCDDAPSYGPAPTLFGLVMSFEEGGSLQDTLFPRGRRRSRASWPAKMADKLRLATEAASGLYSLHALGIVHGDLKLENVLLTGGAEPRVRLADFGLATVNAAHNRMSRISTAQAAADRRGTWPYMVSCGAGPGLARPSASPALILALHPLRPSPVPLTGARDVPHARGAGRGRVPRHRRIRFRYAALGAARRARGVGRLRRGRPRALHCGRRRPRTCGAAL